MKKIIGLLILVTLVGCGENPTQTNDFMEGTSFKGSELYGENPGLREFLDSKNIRIWSIEDKQEYLLINESFLLKKSDFRVSLAKAEVSQFFQVNSWPGIFEVSHIRVYFEAANLDAAWERDLQAGMAKWSGISGSAINMYRVYDIQQADVVVHLLPWNQLGSICGGGAGCAETIGPRGTIGRNNATGEGTYQDVYFSTELQDRDITILHEFGHVLGFADEDDRYYDKYYSGGVSQILALDINSVMCSDRVSMQEGGCGYGMESVLTGFSEQDKLAAQMMYTKNIIPYVSQRNEAVGANGLALNYGVTKEFGLFRGYNTVLTYSGDVWVYANGVWNNLTPGIGPVKKMKIRGDYLGVLQDNGDFGVFNSSFQYLPQSGSVVDFDISEGYMAMLKTNGYLFSKSNTSTTWKVRGAGIVDFKVSDDGIAAIDKYQHLKVSSGHAALSWNYIGTFLVEDFDIEDQKVAVILGGSTKYIYVKQSLSSANDFTFMGALGKKVELENGVLGFSNTNNELYTTPANKKSLKFQAYDNKDFKLRGSTIEVINIYDDLWSKSISGTTWQRHSSFAEDFAK
jgi:hypothetical protein